jgi:hypothetical protein
VGLREVHKFPPSVPIGNASGVGNSFRLATIRELRVGTLGPSPILPVHELDYAPREIFGGRCILRRAFYDAVSEPARENAYPVVFRIHRAEQHRSTAPGIELMTFVSNHYFPRHSHDQSGIGSSEELRNDIDEGVVLWGYEETGTLVGVMGLQPVQDVILIRHA